MEDRELEKWDKLAEDYHKFIVGGKDIFRKNLLDKAVFDLLGSINDKEILDAGCGQGYLSHEMCKRGARVIGVDGAPNFIRIANEKYSHENISFLTQNLKERLPFENRSFDIVIANMVLMDFDPINPTMKEFWRVLRNDGRFIFSILHPIFGNGYPHKTIKEFIFRKMPHYALPGYHRTREENWHIHGLTQTTVIYHRPIEYYADALNASGFVIRKLKELIFEKDFTKGGNNFLKLCSEIPPFLLCEAVKS